MEEETPNVHDRLDTIVRPSNPGEKLSLKNITIRGINTETYDEFSKNIKSLDMNLGDALSKLMKDVNSDFDETFPKTSSKIFKGKLKLSVNHYKELSVSKQDLVEADGRITFSHINNLTFEPDVTREDFETYVRTIQHCRHVRIPSVLPKLVVYSKIAFADDIEIYLPGE